MNILDRAAWQAMRGFLMVMALVVDAVERLTPSSKGILEKKDYIGQRMGICYVLNNPPSLIPPVARQQYLALGYFLLGMAGLCVGLILGSMARVLVS